MEQVYVFDFGDRIKIGYSKNVKQRLRTIELSSGQKAKNVFAVDAGRDVEFIAHSWIPNRLEGEFFAHPYQEAVEVIQKIIAGEIKQPRYPRKTPKALNTQRSNDKYQKSGMVNIRLDENLKKSMEQVCQELGMSMTTAFTIFAKKMSREKRIPFEVSIDPFYSANNLEHLQRGIAALYAGKGTEHELIE